ncbi:hypothetical protein E0Z10_g1491 [Xylaria hypoxylon]|uniref:Protein kinase domain-containing protein n=1 Tax=Xylaria hypoxylon TaxID=37992 RepID=A0A4Z0Z8Q7_9PEZI|nr:hypothetical protein E0Z10_g1491 [Xylaria hypoxylon]
MSAHEERKELRRLGKEVASHFTSNPKFKFVGHAGLGRHGGTLILSEEASAEQEARHIIIKYSYGSLSPDKKSDADEDLRNEYRWLKRLRGAEHIGQLIDLADCSLLIPGLSDGEDTYEESVQRQKDEEAAADDGSQPPTAAPVRRCPTFALEYLTYGTMWNFHLKLFRSGQLWIPSRLLWRIWLCMVRQCVGMAFPPDIPDDEYVGQVIREVMQDKPYSSIAQNSSHAENFMFSVAADLPGNEHEPDLPMVKIIDFGRGKIEDGEAAQRRLPENIVEYASKKNLFGAAQVMMRLCCVYTIEEDSFNIRRSTVPYTWTDASGSHTIQTRAPDVIIQNAIVDPQLRHLLVRIMAHPYASKPSLRDVLNETEIAITHGPDHPGLLTENAALLGVFETDYCVESFMQHWLYDAPES